MLEFENFINVASLFNVDRISKNIKKECNTKKLPHKTPKLHIIPAILRITKKNKKEKKPQEEMKYQLLENIQTGDKNSKTQHPKQIHAAKLLPKSKKHRKLYTLYEYEEQDFDSEIQEIIEILRNALMNMNSDGETRELHSAVNVFVKSGFQKFKEHRKHIEKAMLHINSQKLLKEQARIISIIRSKINKLNEINSIKNLRNKKVKNTKEKDFKVNR